jgi:hypothetical protein
VKATISLCGMTTATLLLATVVATSQDKKDKPESGKADEPGSIHKELARWAGEYTTVSKFRLKPGDEAMESKGTAKIVTALDGRFLVEENTGSQFGEAYKGLRLVGYNNAAKQYEASWTYSKSTAIMSMTGTSKDDGKTIDWIATFSKEKGEKETLYVSTRQIDDDHFVVEIFGKTADGQKGPTLETVYTRKK